ncbi:hypothetical protein, partial [Chloroflexus sp.]
RRGSAMHALPGAERAGGTRSQGILPPTPARPRWERESMGRRGSAMHALPGDERAGGVRSQGDTGLAHDGDQVARRGDVGLRDA